MRIIAERGRLAVIELADSGRYHYHVVELNTQGRQVFSAVPSDTPRYGGRCFAGMTDTGVDYVSHSRTRPAAMALLRKYAPDYPTEDEMRALTDSADDWEALIESVAISEEA